MPQAEIRFYSKTPINPTFKAQSKRVIAIVNVSKRLSDAELKLSLICLRMCSLSHQHFIGGPPIGTLKSTPSLSPRRSSPRCSRWALHVPPPTIWQINCYMSELDEHAKMKLLTMVMASSRSSKMSTCSTWLLYFNEGEGSKFNCFVNAFLAYWPSWNVFSRGPRDALNQSVFPLVIQIAKGISLVLALVSGIPLTQLDKGIQNVIIQTGGMTWRTTRFQFFKDILIRELPSIGFEANGVHHGDHRGGATSEWLYTKRRTAHINPWQSIKQLANK